MEILSNLGVDGRILLAQIVNFCILLWILNRFVYRPLLAFLEQRTKKIEQGLKNAESAREQLAAAQAEKEDLLRKAREEAKVVILQSEQAAKKQQELALAETKDKITQMLTAGEKKLTEERTKMLAEVRGELAQLVVLVTEKVLQAKVDSAESERLALSALREMDK